MILATVAGMTTSERVHNQLCSLALGHLYAALFSRDNDFGLSVEFVRKRAYSFGHVHPNNLVVAVDDPPRLSQNTFQNEAVDNARWFAFQAIIPYCAAPDSIVHIVYRISLTPFSVLLIAYIMACSVLRLFGPRARYFSPARSSVRTRCLKALHGIIRLF